MDEMNIVSKFMTGMVSKIITKVLKQKLGYDVKLRLNEIKITVTDGQTHLHLDADADIDKDELTRIIKANVGL